MLQPIQAAGLTDTLLGAFVRPVERGGWWTIGVEFLAFQVFDRISLPVRLPVYGNPCLRCQVHTAILCLHDRQRLGRPISFIDHGRGAHRSCKSMRGLAPCSKTTLSTADIAAKSDTCAPTEACAVAGSTQQYHYSLLSVHQGPCPKMIASSFRPARCRRCRRARIVTIVLPGPLDGCRHHR